MLHNGLSIVNMSEELMQIYKNSIELIEHEQFSQVWVWNISNFKMPYFNKYECSFLLFRKSNLVWYVIWTCVEECGYINRIAVSRKEGGKGLWKFLINHFHNNIIENFWAYMSELVTHDCLWVDKFYHKLWYKEYNSQRDIGAFLEKKNKIQDLHMYYGDGKLMTIFYIIF